MAACAGSTHSCLGRRTRRCKQCSDASAAGGGPASHSCPLRPGQGPTPCPSLCAASFQGPERGPDPGKQSVGVGGASDLEAEDSARLRRPVAAALPRHSAWELTSARARPASPSHVLSLGARGGPAWGGAGPASSPPLLSSCMPRQRRPNGLVFAASALRRPSVNREADFLFLIKPLLQFTNRSRGGKARKGLFIFRGGPTSRPRTDSWGQGCRCPRWGGQLESRPRHSLAGGLRLAP